MLFERTNWLYLARSLVLKTCNFVLRCVWFCAQSKNNHNKFHYFYWMIYFSTWSNLHFNSNINSISKTICSENVKLLKIKDIRFFLFPSSPGQWVPETFASGLYFHGDAFNCLNQEKITQVFRARLTSKFQVRCM